MAAYGLSNYAAHNFFLKFAKSLNTTKKGRHRKVYQLKDISTSSLINDIMDENIQEKSLKFFSETLGFDQNYIKDFIFPVIWANYLH